MQMHAYINIFVNCDSLMKTHIVVLTSWEWKVLKITILFVVGNFHGIDFDSNSWYVVQSYF